MILEIKPEQQKVLERAAQSGMSPEDVLDQAFAVIHEQYRNDDWLVADKEPIAAQIEEGFAQSELVVADTVGEICVAGGVRSVCLNHYLRLYPGFVRVALGIQPIVDENKLAIGLRFISQAILRIRARSLESDLLAAYAVESVSGAQVAVELKSSHLLLQLGDFFVRFIQQIISRLRR